MKKLLFISLIITFISCQDKFEPNKYNGDWINMDEDGGFSSLPSIIFKNDSIYFSDAYTYTTKAKFKINRNKISYFFKNDTVINKFNFSSKDSTITIGKNIYYFLKEYSDFSELTDYNLIGIKSKEKVIANSLYSSSIGFHLFKNKNDSLNLKLNDRVTSNLNELSYFINNTGIHDPFTFSTTIYIGKEVNLKNLINCYIRLTANNRNKSLIITDYNFKENSYSIFYDRISLWENQLEIFYKENKIPPVPPNLENYRNKYLKKYSPKIITINSSKDFNLLENINKESVYLISINPEMEIETYLKLKEKLIEIKRKRKVRIKTEFVL
ncbi:hypothetical protein LPB136_05235 [Tenacibaculum todarodis]|uniref:Lipoprotein n=1 Tax=Tenacibaculum todarodis TaxID=1850252 RepID=A0A1L3JI32_9FLAO|nr:hypothetical protein [Tenacibaculum todarodis]APG64800.1 hypothetical protein LPB136_05235 [Tenacibaculum todarodis]